MPYMRVTQSTFDPANADEAARLTRLVVETMRRQPGFQHFHGGFDREGGKGLAITTFDTRDHASFDRQQLGDALRESLAVMQYTPPAIYEVVE
jgi:hypothetical protein